MSRTLIWSVDGMRCASCEERITRSLRDLPGVEETEVSLRQKRAGIRLAENAIAPSVDDLNRLFESAGYRFSPPHANAPDQTSSASACNLASRAPSAALSTRFFRAVFLVAAFGLVTSFVWGPLQHVVPSVSSAASAGAMVGLGLIASLSSCLASTGGFLLAYASKNNKTNPFAIHVGRFMAFAAGGALLGGIGGIIPHITPRATGIASLVFGGILLWAGLHMLDLAPALSAIGIAPPKKLTTFAHTANKTRRTGIVMDAFAGAATFALPCGFTQTAQMLAISSGSATTGAVLLGAFALGTLPALAGVTAFGSSASGATARDLKFAAGAILVVFSLIHIDGGLTLVGARTTLFTAFRSATNVVRESTAPRSNLPREGQPQIVRMSVQNSSFVPDRLTVTAGLPVTWIIDGSQASGCTRDIVIPSYGIQRTLAKGENIITFTPEKPGTIPFSCGMGMVKGSFTVI